MTSWKSGIGKWLIAVLFLVSVFGFQTSVFAATVGGVLTSPETGWQRFDQIVVPGQYSAEFQTYSNEAGDYGGSRIGTNTAAIGASADFKFYGTKIRLIASTRDNRSSSIAVTIDGVTEHFSQKGTSTPVFQVLTYEKTGLTEGFHDVEFNLNTTGSFVIDAFDIDDTGYFVSIDTPMNLSATAGDSQASLSWDKVDNASSYKIYYGTESGDYTQSFTVTEDAYSNYVIPGLTNGTTYYFVVSSTVNGVSSNYSNEATATPQAVEPPDAGRAILTIYLTNGTEKEYDLPMTEINAFIDWYDAKAEGSGSAKYKFVKTWNKGPFSKRTEYVIFDKILTFNVDEYSTED